MNPSGFRKVPAFASRVLNSFSAPESRYPWAPGSPVFSFARIRFPRSRAGMALESRPLYESVMVPPCPHRSLPLA
jgi:hypothetical protein